jgi:hypothetical protein
MKTSMSNDSPKTVLVLRTCDSELKAYGGFQWPDSGRIEAPDWHPKAECGNGLHGLLWGKGDYSHLSTDALAKWMIVEVEEALLVDLGGKVKFPHGNVIYCGASAGAMAILRKHKWGEEPAEITNPSTTGDRAHSSTTGDGAHSSTTGNYAHSSTTGDYAHSSTTGDYAHSSTTGDRAHSSTKGEDSVAACLGYNGRVKSGHGPLIAAYWDGNRRRIAVAYPGENGIEPDAWYSVNERGEFTKVEEGA